jgi:feruloyl-CoA synthase
MNAGIGSLLTQTVLRFPKKIALHCDEEAATYGELETRANRLGNGLMKKGLARGDKVAVLSRNSVDVVVTYFALLKIGAVGVPLNFRWTDSDIVYALDQSDAKALIASEDYMEAARRCTDRVKGIAWYAVIGGERGDSVLSLGKLVDQGGPESPDVEIGSADESFLLYTAGTTGRPKGVILTHGNHLWNAVNYLVAYGMGEEDVELALSPLFHSSTLGRCIAYVLAGATCITSRRFHPRRAWELIEAKGITSITQVPTMYVDMLNVAGAERYDTLSVRRIVTGAAPMASELKRRLLTLFPRATLHDLYGITEAGPGVSISQVDGESGRLDAVGRPLLTTGIKVVDEAGREVVPGEVGEILCRGPHVMKGYHKDPDATAAVLRDGWLRTGDLGKVDAGNVLTLVGRKKDVIISGGENVFPGEVEGILLKHPGIEDACVLEMPHPRWGECTAALVVKKGGAKLDEKQVIDFCKDRLAGYKCPERVGFVTELPRNAAGKIVKEELKKEVLMGPP